MHKIRILNNISPLGLQNLPPEQYQITEDNYDAILLRSAPLHDMPVNPELKAIARAGAGVNNIPIDTMTTHGIPVFNTPGANANAVKELVIAGLLIACRNLCHGWQAVQSLHTDDLDRRVETMKKQFSGQELMGKTLGLIGLGAIGVKVANAAIHLGMNVIAYDPHLTVSNAWQLSPAVNQADNLQATLQAADFVTIHIPYSESTHHLLDATLLSCMKPSASLLNFSRSGIIDEDFLIKLLNQGQLDRYISDFPSAELLRCDKVLCFPHLGASTKEAEENCAVMAINTLKRFLEWGEIENSVNFPNISMPYHGGTRIGIVNHNVPNMLSQISQDIAKHALNIKDMINRSHNNIAYTLIDIDGTTDHTLSQTIQNIQGIIKCRVIVTA